MTGFSLLLAEQTMSVILWLKKTSNSYVVKILKLFSFLMPEAFNQDVSIYIFLYKAHIEFFSLIQKQFAFSLHGKKKDKYPKVNL